MTETGAQPPAQLLQALDAVLSASSSSAEGTPPPDDEALHRQALSTSREAEHEPREVRGKRHKGASAGGDPANDAPLGRKSRKRKRKRGKGASALLQDDVRKGLQHEIEYAQMGRRQRPGDDEPWTEADGPTVDATAKEGPRKQAAAYDVSRKPDADNLVFGAPREGGHRSTFKRSAWAGLSDAPARFAALLLGKAGRMQAALAAGELAESQPPGISERYFAAPPARQRLQAWGVTARTSGLSRVTGVPRAPQLLPDALETASGASAHEHQVAHDSVLDRTERLSKRTRLLPRDVAAWLQYVCHQEDVLSLAQKQHRARHSKALAAKQLAILEVALEANPQSEELLLVMMCQVLPQVVDTQQLGARWRTLLARHSASPLLWARHFAFLASLGQSASLDALRACCVDATLALAGAAAAGAAGARLGSGSAAQPARIAAECAAADAAVRHMAVELASGETHRACQLLQAALEWAAFPCSTAGGAVEQARWFRTFWQSDAPKVGEARAKGFAQWVAEQHGAPVAEAVDEILERPPAAASQADVGWSGWLEGVEAEAEAAAEAVAGVSEAPKVAAAEDADAAESDGDLEAGRVPEDMDEIDEMMLRAELGLEVEKELEALEAQGLTAAEVQQLVAVEAERSCAAPLPGAQASTSEDAPAAEAQTPLTPNDVRHMLLFGAHPDTTRLLTHAALRCLDVPVGGVSGLAAAAAAPFCQQLRDRSTGDDGATLSAVLGFAGAAQGGGDGGSQWSQVESFEARAEGATVGTPWYARTQGRHRFVRSILLQMLAPGGRFASDPDLIRALFRVEAAPVCLSTGSQRQTAEDAVARARASAKRWLQDSFLSGNLTAYGAFAALEAAASKHAEAIRIVHTAMRAASGGGGAPARQHERWTLAAQAALLHFEAAGLPLGIEVVSERRIESRTWRRCCAHATHAILWAATASTPAATPFQALSKTELKADAVSLAHAWQPRVQAARSNGLHTVLAAAAAGAASPGAEASSSGAGVSAGVVCALMFEVTGQGCGALPDGGWQRARGIFEHCVGAAPVEVRAASAAHAAWACTLTTLAGCPGVSASLRDVRAVLLPLIRTHPHATYLYRQLAALQAAAHQSSQLRVDTSQLLAQPALAAAPSFAMAAAVAQAGQVGGRHRVQGVLEGALRGAQPLDLAMQMAAARAAGGERGAGGKMEALEREMEQRAEAAASHAAAPGDVPLPLLANAQPLDGSPATWLAYVRWCVATGALRDAHAVLLRAISACPWAKGLWLQGMHEVAEGVAGVEAGQLAAAMQERGLPLLTQPAEMLLERMQEAEGL